MATIEELEAAQAELARVEKAWENYSGNNPNKYRVDLQDARRRVRQIESALKRAGELPMTDEEILFAELDAAFPRARSKDEVEHCGVRYRRRATPLSYSRSGKTVTEWRLWWEALGQEAGPESM